MQCSLQWDLAGVGVIRRHGASRRRDSRSLTLVETAEVAAFCHTELQLTSRHHQSTTPVMKMSCNATQASSTIVYYSRHPGVDRSAEEHRPRPKSVTSTCNRLASECSRSLLNFHSVTELSLFYVCQLNSSNNINLLVIISQQAFIKCVCVLQEMSRSRWENAHNSHECMRRQRVDNVTENIFTRKTSGASVMESNNV